MRKKSAVETVEPKETPEEPAKDESADTADTEEKEVDTRPEPEKVEVELPVVQSHFFIANKFFYEDHDYARAIEEYKQATEEEKDELIMLKATYLLGESYIKLGKIDEAKEVLGTIAIDHKQHYLRDSARRRIERLTNYIVPV